LCRSWQRKRDNFVEGKAVEDRDATIPQQERSGKACGRRAWLPLDRQAEFLYNGYGRFAILPARKKL
jgi:hypothetical protein